MALAGAMIYCTNCSGGFVPYTYYSMVWIAIFNTAGISYAIGKAHKAARCFVLMIQINTASDIVKALLNQVNISGVK